MTTRVPHSLLRRWLRWRLSTLLALLTLAGILLAGYRDSLQRRHLLNTTPTDPRVPVHDMTLQWQGLFANRRGRSN